MTGQEPDVGSPPTLASPPTDPTASSASSDPAAEQPGIDFRQLFEDSYQPLMAYARRRSASASDADDLVAEVFAVAWRRRHEIRPGTPGLPWLYGIAGNVLRNQRRSDQRRLRLVDHLQAQPEPAPSGPAADPAGAVDGDGVEVREALATLSFDDQEVLRLIAWEGLSHAEVGQVLDCTANAVAIRAHRARQRLAEALNTPPTSHPSAPTTPDTDPEDHR